jgi:hypothetical protein
MALADFLDELKLNAQAATRGFAKSATLGLVQYPQAGLKQLVNGGTFGENLSDLRAEEAQLAADHPVPYQGGSAAGTLLQAAGTGGGGLLGMVGRGAIQGGVSGFTQNEDLGDAAAGAGVGAGLGALARGVDIGKNMFLRGQMKSHYSGIVGAQEQRIADLAIQRSQLQAARATTSSPKELAQIDQSLRTINQRLGGAKGVLTQAKPKLSIAKNGDEQAMLDLAGEKGASALAHSAINNAGLNLAAGGALGGVLGGAGAAFTGSDPVKGALYGAGLLGAGSLIKGKAALLASAPRGLTETAARGATAVAVPRLVAPDVLPSEPHPWEDTATETTPEQAAPATKTKSEPHPWED